MGPDSPLQRAISQAQRWLRGVYPAGECACLIATSSHGSRATRAHSALKDRGRHRRIQLEALALVQQAGSSGYHPWCDAGGGLVQAAGNVDTGKQGVLWEHMGGCRALQLAERVLSVH